MEEVDKFEALRMSFILLQFAQGAEIERREKNGNTWEPCISLPADWESYDYRLKTYKEANA